MTMPPPKVKQTRCPIASPGILASGPLHHGEKPNDPTQTAEPDRFRTVGRRSIRRLSIAVRRRRFDQIAAAPATTSAICPGDFFDAEVGVEGDPVGSPSSSAPPMATASERSCSSTDRGYGAAGPVRRAVF